MGKGNTITMYVAKMTTRYPDYHGEGYYNFLMDNDYDKLMNKVENYSHDFKLEKVATVLGETAKDVTERYPTKEKLNETYFQD